MITQAMCTSFKVELLTGTHNFTSGTGDVFKIALYTSSANLDATTTNYISADEVVGAGYVAGGEIIVSVTPTSTGTIAFTDFNDAIWPNSTITANGALIYNSSKANKAVAVLAFGGDKTTVGGDFSVIFPTPNAANAIIRIA